MRAYLALGGVYASKEDFRSAADVYDKAVARLTILTSANWNIFYQRGIAYERLKEWPKAEPNFRKALELYPEPAAGHELSRLFLGRHEHEPRRGHGPDPQGGRSQAERRLHRRFAGLGATIKLGKFDDAVRELERAVSLKPDDPVLNDHLGDAYWRAGRRLEATFQWAHARDMKPDKDVLASVQKKLAEGLPPLEGKTAPIRKTRVPAPTAAPDAPPPIEKKSELIVPAEPAPAASRPPRSMPAAYTVQPGQSLWSIAVDKLGDGARYLRDPQSQPAACAATRAASCPARN